MPKNTDRKPTKKERIVALLKTGASVPSIAETVKSPARWVRHLAASEGLRTFSKVVPGGALEINLLRARLKTLGRRRVPPQRTITKLAKTFRVSPIEVLNYFKSI